MNKEWTVEYDQEGKDGVRDIRHGCAVLTDEDWYPTVDGKLSLTVVSVAYYPMIRIHIWGGDDFGMEKDYNISEITFEEAKKEADAIPEPITVRWLLENGFIYA